MQDSIIVYFVLLDQTLVTVGIMLLRVPWRRSAGSCSTAKGASSGEVRPVTYYCLPETHPKYKIWTPQIKGYKNTRQKFISKYTRIS